MTAEKVEKLLEDIRAVSEERYQVAQGLRDVVLSVSPDVFEEVKYGGFLFSADSPFCGVFSYAHHVSLELSEGARLADPHQVLEGSGKHRRHIKLRATTDVEGKHVREYVESAFAAVGRT